MLNPPSRLYGVGVLPLWRYRRLLPYLGMEYIRWKYRGSWLGLIWVPLRPTADLLMRTLFFGGFLGVASAGRPYILFLVAGTAPWVVFERVSHWGYRSLQLHHRIISRVRVPWTAPVTATAVPGIVEGALYGVIGLVLASYYRISDGTFYFTLGAETLTAVAGFALLVAYGWAVGAWTAPLVLLIPDLRLVFRYMFTFWYFLTPVLYDRESIPDRYQSLAEYNPVTAPVELVKHGLLGTELPTEASLRISVIILVVALGGGLIFLGQSERRALRRL